MSEIVGRVESVESVGKVERVFMHVDLDAFFAACEVNRNPSLKGKPVIVGADPKDGKGRGVVSTCSYEARKFGIHSGMPISWAYKRCPHAVFLPVDMSYYAEISSRIMYLVREKFSGCKFEQTSIDEATFDVSLLGYEKAEALAREFRQELEKKEGLTCSIGISQNPLVAKIASDFQKPDGLTVVRPHEVRMFLYPLLVRKLPGVGPKMEEALQKIGVDTIGRLAAVPKEKLVRYFGKLGEYLHSEAQGKDDREIGGEWKAKSISRQATFEEDTSDKKKIFSALEELVEEVLADVKESKIKFKTIIVKVRYEDFSTHTKQKKFKSSLSEKDARAWTKELLKLFLRDKRKVRLLGFGVSELSSS